MLEVYPTEFECTDETGEPIFKITMFDAYCANVHISSSVTRGTWPEISGKIFDCLEQMNLET